jgi:hypothetical protein
LRAATITIYLDKKGDIKRGEMARQLNKTGKHSGIYSCFFVVVALNEEKIGEQTHTHIEVNKTKHTT